MTNKKLKSKAFAFLRKKVGHDLAVKMRQAYQASDPFEPLHETLRNQCFRIGSSRSAMAFLGPLKEAGVQYRESFGRDMGYPGSSPGLLAYYFTGRTADCTCCCEYSSVYLS